MPNRVIKESIRTSKSVNAMTDFQFRLWIYLITYVDDYGRGSADAELIKGFVFPRLKRIRESDIEKEIANLADMGAIRLYKVDGESLLYFPNWDSHQRIQTKKSKFPQPPTKDNDNQPEFTVGHGESPPEYKYESNTDPKTNTESEYIEGADAGASADCECPAKYKRGKFVPPTVEEVRAYCFKRRNNIDAQNFIDYFTVSDWIDSEGKPVRSWKQKIITWEGRTKNGSNSGHNNAHVPKNPGGEAGGYIPKVKVVEL